MTEAEALAHVCAEKLWAEDSASRGLGMALRDIAPGHAVLTMQVQPHMVNGHGVCHGGFIFTLADSAMAFASNTVNQASLAQHCAVTFLHPARLGDTLAAEANERIRDGRAGIYDVCVRALDGSVIAEFRGHTRTTGQKILPEPGDG